jgi:hypothetical protein
MAGDPAAWESRKNEREKDEVPSALHCSDIFHAIRIPSCVLLCFFHGILRFLHRKGGRNR